MSATADKTKSRRHWITLLKIVFLLIAATIVWRQVSWHDEVTRQDGSLVRGRFISGMEPDAKNVQIQPVDESMVLELADGAWEADSKHIGLRTTIENLDPGPWVWGMVMIFATYCLGVLRWKKLLEAQGIPTSYGRSFKLTFIGFFASNVMPGMTGGDVVKAVMIARDSPGKRSEAVSTVIVDRAVGLAVLALLGVVVVLTCAVDKPGFRNAGMVVFAVLVLCGIGFVCLFSRRVRSRLGINRLLKALPGSDALMKLDRAFLDYRTKPESLVWAVLLSIVSHFLNVGSVVAFGWALGLPRSEVPIITYFATVPLIFIAASAPVFPAGWGIRETLFINVFLEVGVKAVYKSQLMLLSILLGLSLLLISLLGGVFLFSGRRHGEIPAEIV